MSSWGVIHDTCGNSLDKNLAPVDIKVGEDMHTCIRQRGSNSHGKEVGGSGELISRCIQSGKDNQVPLRCLPAGRHPNTGKGQDRGKSIVADTHEARGQDASLHLEGRVERVTNEAQHEVGPRRGGSRLRQLGRGLGLGLASTLWHGLGRLRLGSSCGIGGGSLLRG